MPVHNGAAFISKAIGSVLTQTFRDFDLLVIDDGSTDETASVVHSFNDDRVRYFYQGNRGPSAARNTGIQHSAASWVAFLDSDDYWLPKKLEAQLSVARARPQAGMIYCSAHVCGADGNVLWTYVATVEGRPLDRLLVGNCISGSASSVMLRRDVLDAIGYFDEALPVSEDWELWLRAARATDVAKVDDPLVCIINRPGSIGKRAEQIRDVSIAVADRAFATYAADRRHLRRRMLWQIHYFAAVTHQEQGAFAAARRDLIKSILYRPTYIRAYWRLARALLGRR
jgi:glycosyltransferase involved in cell wall biosynthesis